MNFAQYLAVTNRTNPTMVTLKEWEKRFVANDWPDAIGSCEDVYSLKVLLKFATRVKVASEQMKFDALTEECDILIPDVAARIVYLENN